MKTVLLLLLIWSLAAGVEAARLEVFLVDTTAVARAPLGAADFELASGGEARFGPIRVETAEGPVQVSARLQVTSEGGRETELVVHAFVEGREGGAAKTWWTSRRVTMAAGDAAEVAAPAPMAHYALRVRRVDGTEATGAALGLVVRLREAGTAAGERELELPGGAATVVLTGDGGEPLRVTVTPSERGLKGARLEVAVDGMVAGADAGAEVEAQAPQRVVMRGSYRISWGEILRIAGLESPRGAVFLELVARP